MHVVMYVCAAYNTCACLQVLELALDKLGARPAVYRMNPKAMPRHQLLGSLNLDTREWTDGVLTAAARKVSVRGLSRLLLTGAGEVCMHVCLIAARVCGVVSLDVHSRHLAALPTCLHLYLLPCCWLLLLHWVVLCLAGCGRAPTAAQLACG